MNLKSERYKLLQKLKSADLKNDVPSVSEPVAQFLHDLILERGFTAGLEIGTAHAYSSIWLGDGFEQNKGILHTIEHSPPSFNQAKINLYRAKLEHTVLQHAGRAQTVVPQLEGDFDFIFIDGIKKSTLEFFTLTAARLRPHGVIVVDDVIKFKDKMIEFYDWIEAQTHWKHTVYPLDSDDGIMVIEPAG